MLLNPKALQPKRTTPIPIPTGKGIRLQPFATDYATFVLKTSMVLGTTGPASRKTRPNAQLLSLASLASSASS